MLRLLSSTKSAYSGPFDIDVGVQRLDRRQRRRLVEDRHVVDDLERRHLARPTILGEGDRALLGDVPISGDRHDKDVAERLRLLEVNQMAEMNQVEGAMAQHDLLVEELDCEGPATRRAG